MEKRISATEMVRNFSDILNAIKFRGDSYIIERSGKSVASMKPVEPNPPRKRLKDLEALLQALPSLGEELESFAADVAAAENEEPGLPDDTKWE